MIAILLCLHEAMNYEACLDNYDNVSHILDYVNQT